MESSTDALYKDITKCDHLNLSQNSYIKEYLRVSEEDIFLSMKVAKYNKFSIRQERILMVTDRKMYNMEMKGKWFIVLYFPPF